MRNLLLLFLTLFQLRSIALEPVFTEAILERKVESFKVNGPLPKVLDELKKESSKLNIVYLTEYDQLDETDFGAPFEIDSFGEFSIVSPLKEFELNFKKKSVREILKEICEKWNLRYLIDEQAVIIFQPTRESEEEYPEFYSLNSFDQDKIDTSNVKLFLRNHDIDFPKDQPIKYLKSLNSLAVVLTHHNHTKLQKVLVKYSLRNKLKKLSETIQNVGVDKAKIEAFTKDFLDLNKQFNRPGLKKVNPILEEQLSLIIPRVKVANSTLKEVVVKVQELSKKLSENGQEIKLGIPTDFASEIQGKVNLDLKWVSLKKFIYYACQQLDIKYYFEEDTVYFGWQQFNLSTELYPISAQVLEYMDKNSLDPNYTRILKSIGIEFGLGSRIKFPKTRMALVITNSKESHRKIKEFFDFLYDVKVRSPFLE